MLNKISVKRLIFCKSGTSLQLKCGKLPVKAGSNMSLTAPPKPLVAIGKLQCDFFRTKNDRSNKKKTCTQVNQDMKAFLFKFSGEGVNRFESKQLFCVWWEIYKGNKSLNQEMLKGT